MSPIHRAMAPLISSRWNPSARRNCNIAFRNLNRISARAGLRTVLIEMSRTVLCVRRRKRERSIRPGWNPTAACGNWQTGKRTGKSVKRNKNIWSPGAYYVVKHGSHRGAFYAARKSAKNPRRMDHRDSGDYRPALADPPGGILVVSARRVSYRRRHMHQSKLLLRRIVYEGHLYPAAGVSVSDAFEAVTYFTGVPHTVY